MGLFGKIEMDFPDMENRRLGDEGPFVSVLGFGAWPIGGGLGTVSEEQGIRAVHTAIDAGITLIDTAEGYLSSESVLGKSLSLKGSRDKLVIATKLSGEDHSWAHMSEAIDNSLRKLRTDYIDIYQIHSPQPRWPIEETMEGMLRLQEQGKIRYVGVSNFSPKETAEAMEYGQIVSAQPRYNMVWRETQDVLDFCLEHGLGVLPHSVLSKGILGGKYRPGHFFENDDERTRFNFFKGDYFREVHQAVTKLDDWAKDHGRDIAQLAIAWILAQPGITSALVGAKSDQQVLQNVKAASWKLTEEELEEIEMIQNGFRITWIKAD